MTQEKKHWGYALLGKGRPEADAQRQLLRVVGVDVASPDAYCEDVLPERPTRPLTAMPMRAFLKRSVEPGDTVHVASLLCLGVSPADMFQFVNEVLQAGACIAVHQEALVFDPATDLHDGMWCRDKSEPVIDDFRRARQAAYMRTSRAKRASKVKDAGQ